MQRPNKHPHDSDEPDDTALIPYSASSSSVIRAEALSETALTKRQKTDQEPLAGRGPGHTFDRSIACDNARVQYGDTYNVSYHQAAEPVPEEGGCQEALSVLRFPQMNLRRQLVRDAHTGTCEWILERPEYKSWCDAEQIPLHHGFLWIKSKPGAGKSTLMKFLLELAEQQSSPDDAVISFFFNARGDLLERSLEGMYRQLLHQLLSSNARLQSMVPAADISGLEPLGWPRQLLENLFKKCVLGLRQQRVTCFIDALDECPESEIRELVEFFEGLGNFTTTKGIYFRVCFSSRHYPNVSLENCQHFVLDGQSGHQHDIAAYIDSKLRLRKSKTNQEIKAAVQKRAQGVFLWVVLVVKRLNQDVDRGNVHNLRSRLDEVPDGLDALFRDTLKLTGNDDEMLIQMLQWMMYAQETLTREELYFGVHAGMISDGDPEPWDRDEITSEVIDLFIVNCSRGLIESTTEGRPRMQFIHESVRDYLFGGGLELLAPKTRNNVAGVSHDYLKRSCLNLFKKSSTFSHIPPCERLLETQHEQAHVNSARGLTKQYPLLRYASDHTLLHAESASQCGVDQLGFVTSFPLQTWNRIHMLNGWTPARSKTEVFALFRCHELLRYEIRPSYPLLAPEDHVLAIRTAIGDHVILELILKRGTVANIYADDQFSLIQRAVHSEELHCLKTLLDSGIRLRTDESFRLLLSQASFNQHSAIAETLLDHEAEVGPFTADPLHSAINRGSLSTVEALLASGANVNAGTMQVNTASKPMNDGKRPGRFVMSTQDHIWHSATQGIDDSERVFLDRESAEHLTMLEYAALIGRENIVDLFLENEGKQSDIPSQHYRIARPLYLAALLGRHTVVSRLLKDTSWLSSPVCTIWHDSLYAAAVNGHSEVVKVLLAHATCVQTPNLRLCYEDAITLTALRGDKQILRILLDEAPHIPVCGQRALIRALVGAKQCKYDECVKILKERDAKYPDDGTSQLILPVLPWERNLDLPQKLTQ